VLLHGFLTRHRTQSTVDALRIQSCPAMVDAQESPSEFLQFSIAVYGESTVSDACLWLQDEFGIDVNFLLFVLFCGHRGYAITVDDIERLENHLRPWRENVVRPMRRVRRWLKQQTNYADVDTIRQPLLALEIECEKRQQRMMESLLSPQGAPSGQVAAANAVRYLAACGVRRSTAVVDRLAAVLCAIFPGLSNADAKTLLQQAS